MIILQFAQKQNPKSGTIKKHSEKSSRIKGKNEKLKKKIQCIPETLSL
jgi:hypothetical protein